MGAISFLYLILPLPFIFILHYLEEEITSRLWLTKNRDRLITHFPKLSGIVKRLDRLDTFAFLFVTFEESLVFLIILAMFVDRVPYIENILFAFVLVFGIRLLVKVAEAVAFRGYVPGFATAVSFLVPLWFILYYFFFSHFMWEIIAFAICGIVFIVVNKIFAYWLGWKISLGIHYLYRRLTKKSAA